MSPKDQIINITEDAKKVVLHSIERIKFKTLVIENWQWGLIFELNAQPIPDDILRKSKRKPGFHLAQANPL
jgi:hypothetical protein